MNTQMTRRRALSLLSGAIAAFWSAVVAAVAGTFVTYPLRSPRKRNQASLGKLVLFGAEFRMVHLEMPIADGWHRRVEPVRVYVRTSDSGTPEVFSATCTHLSCTVKWNPETNQFECPCHGGRFAPDGTVLAGPPPAPLARIPAEVRGGEILIELT